MFILTQPLGDIKASRPHHPLSKPPPEHPSFSRRDAPPKAAKGAGPACPLSRTSPPRPDAQSRVTALTSHSVAPHLLPPCVCARSGLTLRPRGLEPSRLLCPSHSPGKHTRVGCHSFLQGILPTQGVHPTHVSCITGRFFSVEPSGKSQELGERTSTSMSGRTQLSPSQSVPGSEGSVPGRNENRRKEFTCALVSRTPRLPRLPVPRHQAPTFSA